MKIVLVRIVEFRDNHSFHPRDVIPSFELLNIAALLKNNSHQVEYLDNEILNLNIEKFKQLILGKSSDIYIFNFQPMAAMGVCRIVKAIKKKLNKKITIAFGTTIEHQTGEFLVKSGVDFALHGEAEITVGELVNSLSLNPVLKLGEKKKIKGLVFLHNKKIIKNKPRPMLNPDKLPFLAHELIQSRKYKVISKIIKPKKRIKWGFLLSSRGCPYNCIFCSPSIRNSFGKEYRFQSPKRTIDEIEYMIKKFKINAISFEDDIFTFNKKRVKEICNQIISRKLNISWTVATRLDCLDLPLLRLMKKAGCHGMSVGVESGSDRILKLINKGESVKDIIKGAKLLNKVGIAVTINLIIGHPTETKKEIQATLDIAKRIKPVFIHLHYLTPYPGTIFFLKYKNKIEEFESFSHRQPHMFNISAVESKYLRKMMGDIYFSFYFNILYLKTYLKYRIYYWIFDPLFEIDFLSKVFSFFLFRKKNVY